MNTCLRFTLLILVLVAGCESTTRRVIYNDRNYDQLPKAEHVTITFVDGRTAQFYRMEIVKTDSAFIYARCWEKKKGEPKDYRFRKSEIIIEDTQFSTPNAVGYVLSLAITIGILLLLQKLLYD